MPKKVCCQPTADHEDQLEDAVEYDEHRETMAKYGLKPFEELTTSTSTIMVYTNIVFDIPVIFKSLPWKKVDVPLTKKQKNVDKKKLVAPYGAIISVQAKTQIRGLDLRRKKKKWCSVCRPVKMVDDEEVKVFTVTEFLEDAAPAVGAPTDIKNIMYYCSKCQRSYRPEELKKINHFLNQLTVVLSVGTQPLLNIMMFKDNLKFAGCKNVDDAVEAIMVLWQDHIVGNPKAWKLKDGETTPKFVFEVVMRNVDFKLGFPIERPALNMLMNREEFSDKIFMSQYESTGHTNVNIKMHSVKPEHFKYDCLVMPTNGTEPYFTKVKLVKYKTPKKKDKYPKYVTFIVFSSSEIICSGRYDENMKEMYEFFVRTVFDYRQDIEEKLEAPETGTIAKIRTRAVKKLGVDALAKKIVMVEE